MGKERAFPASRPLLPLAPYKCSSRPPVAGHRHRRDSPAISLPSPSLLLFLLLLPPSCPTRRPAPARRRDARRPRRFSNPAAALPQVRRSLQILSPLKTGHRWRALIERDSDEEEMPGSRWLAHDSFSRERDENNENHFWNKSGIFLF